MASNSPGIPAGRLAQYAMLVAAVPGLERKGAKTPYTSLNGNMSSFLTDSGCLALRLDADARASFMRRHDATLCERHGRTMREYVAVPESLWKDRKELRRAFVSSVAYVGTLKPKVTKTRKPALQTVSRTSEVKEPAPREATTRAKPAARKAAAKSSSKASAGTSRAASASKTRTKAGGARKTATKRAGRKAAARKSTRR